MQAGKDLQLELVQTVGEDLQPNVGRYGAPCIIITAIYYPCFCTSCTTITIYA